ncbi:MAG: MBL fold metallo-hydrolase, partial [Armatimonadota bacterium]
RMGSLTLYHSGDCVPYNGLPDHLREKRIDVALLPVNGRDSYRKNRGVPGNFSLAEAVQLCEDAHIPVLIAHHFGMFDFNTIDVNEARKKISSVGGIMPQVDKAYVFTESVDCVGGKCE